MNYEQMIAYLTGKVRAYRQTFNINAPSDVAVLADLARFCRANETCAVPGDRDRTMMLLGRNEVWLRIQQHLNLNPEQLFTALGGTVQNTEGKTQ